MSGAEHTLVIHPRRRGYYTINGNCVCGDWAMTQLFDVHDHSKTVAEHEAYVIESIQGEHVLHLEKRYA